MESTDPRLKLRQEAAELIEDLRDARVERAHAVIVELRAAREFELMARLAELLSRRRPGSARLRSLYGQALVELGMATAALDVIGRALDAVGRSDAHWAELMGLRGRAWKQIYIDASDRTGRTAVDALQRGLAAYEEAYRADPSGNYWHGVNVLGLGAAAERAGVTLPAEIDRPSLAAEIDVSLAPRASTYWEFASLAEAAVASHDWARAESYLRSAVSAPDATAFAVAGTLRQFTELYELQHGEAQGHGLVQTLRAHLATLEGATLQLPAGDVRGLAYERAPDSAQLEAVLGVDGPQTWQWWQGGLHAALSVVSVSHAYGRHGSGFLVRGGDFHDTLGDEPCVLTNFHVVNRQGVAPGLPPREAHVVLEAIDPSRARAVTEIAWESPMGRHDAALLRIADAHDLAPLTLHRELPTVDPDDVAHNPRVYVIGHPGGRELSFSFQDNVLLDHEDRAGGRRSDGDVCRIHYRTPTERGSSGSPVFEAQRWRVLALHHAGSKEGLAKLNGRTGLYAANEGISIASIVDAARREPPAAV